MSRETIGRFWSERTRTYDEDIAKADLCALRLQTCLEISQRDTGRVKGIVWAEFAVGFSPAVQID